jgi:acyl dehydratase
MAELPSVKVGDTRSEVVIDNLSRTQIVMYAGASGDYNPLHTNEVYATKVAGYPSVFAHGMLSMGATGRILTDWFGVNALSSFGVRFLSQVWPGDTLTAAVRVTDIHQADGVSTLSLDVVTTNQKGEIVLSGSARVSLENESM